MRKITALFRQHTTLLAIVLVAIFAVIGYYHDLAALQIPLVMFGMAEIKSMAAIKEKWTRVTPGRAEDYQNGVRQPRRDWAGETSAAAPNWKAGVDAAAAKGLFAKGVGEAGTKKWQEKSLAKGPGRFAEGVYQAGGDYEKGFAPYRAAIAAVDLGPKFPRRDPRNLDRVKRVVTALVEAKVGK